MKLVISVFADGDLEKGQVRCLVGTKPDSEAIVSEELFRNWGGTYIIETLVEHDRGVHELSDLARQVFEMGRAFERDFSKKPKKKREDNLHPLRDGQMM